MLASLPWYDLEEIAPATDQFWQCLARNLRQAGLANVPEELNRNLPYERQWASSELLFSQSCGYDVLIAYETKLQLVATPRYTAPGCQGSTYSSLVLVREDSASQSLEDLRGTRCVINTRTSHSGMNILRTLVAPLHCDGRFFSSVKLSGAHEASISMILGRNADLAAIDCVTYALLGRHRPRLLSGTRVLFRTQQVPAPPYVTSAVNAEDVLQSLRRALAETLEDPKASSIKEELLLDNVDFLPLDAYQPVADFEKSSLDHGYWQIPHWVEPSVGDVTVSHRLRLATEEVGCEPAG